MDDDDDDDDDDNIYICVCDTHTHTSTINIIYLWYLSDNLKHFLVVAMDNICQSQCQHVGYYILSMEIKWVKAELNL
jgi:hypothetical protein